ncbi:hypothetical protein Van01_46520 [Micromonospora andamanensis]|uniref:Uncharacterized protein n=1 Tax=Micromonospora andamanensis TaxID=1287068 RepID=A0ABQ4I0N2_9ACTN|nr:hypothetical protein Van01_46520 [Micromonospora andamanensis]
MSALLTMDACGADRVGVRTGPSRHRMGRPADARYRLADHHWVAADGDRDQEHRCGLSYATGPS